MSFAFTANDMLKLNRETTGLARPRFPMPVKQPVTLFGRRLRAARLAVGMRQSDLGAALGMADQNTGAPRISRYESGKSEPDNATVEQIAEILGLPAAYFYASSDILAEVILLVAKMPKKDQKEVLDLLRKRATKA